MQAVKRMKRKIDDTETFFFCVLANVASTGMCSEENEEKHFVFLHKTFVRLGETHEKTRKFQMLVDFLLGFFFRLYVYIYACNQKVMAQQNIEREKHCIHVQNPI